MAIQQLYIQLHIERDNVGEDGESYKSYHLLDVDLVNDNVAEFLSKIPDDISNHSCLAVALVRDDGEIITFADGMVPEGQGEGWLPMKHIRAISGMYEAMHNDVKLFSQRHFDSLKRNE